MKKRPSKLFSKRTGEQCEPKFKGRKAKFIENMADPAIRSATEAANKAGYSERTARQQASRMLTNVDISKAIDLRKSVYRSLADVEAKDVLGLTVRRAFATIDDCLDENGHFSVEKARETGAIDLIESISRRQTKYGEHVTFRMCSAAEAQKELGEYLGLKTLSRENEEKIKQVINAMLKFFRDRPEANREAAFGYFSKVSGFTVDQLKAEVERAESNGAREVTRSVS